MKTVFKVLKESRPFVELLELVSASRCAIHINGMTGSLGSFLAASIHDITGKTVLLVTSGPTEAETTLDDLTSILGSERVGFLPPLFRHNLGARSLAIGPRNERAEALMRIGTGKPTVMVTQPEALLERGPDRAWLDSHSVSLRQGEGCSLEKILSKLYDADYQRESLVDAQGQFAVRGGLIDVFPFGKEYPFRLELVGDVIESLRLFDPTSQRSVEKINDISFLLGVESDCFGSGLLSLLPDETVLFWNDLGEIEDRVERFRQRLENTRNSVGKETGGEPVRDYQSLREIRSEAERFRQVIWSGLIKRSKPEIDFSAVQPEPFPPGLDKLFAYLKSYVDRGNDVWIAVDAKGERERLDELLSESELYNVRTFTPSVFGGFVSDEIGVAMLTAHQLFNRRRLRSHHTRFRRRTVQFDRAALRKNDLVVHTEYGIGMFEGLQTVKVQGQPRECLRIRYQDDIILFIRVENFGLVEKYSGSEGVKPQLSRIGTRDWVRTKKRTRKALQDMAAELIKLYAERKVISGQSFPEDTQWQKEMETSFEFEDTPDQVTTTTDVKADMEAPHPMDRLLCGDVGFGKTEIAVRAAFKVVQESFQVAILVPTTILAQQHAETFFARLSAYPIRIETLSRFRTPAEQREIVKGLKNGAVDIVIGTHRLLSKDVAFKELGLLVIDEEHRFGVRHKEKLKQFKTNVDVLTLTATPIPRTLHLALMGARDTSLINTPPEGRLPVQTEVHGWSEELIREAILREIDRQGQVFFVHNRVQSIHAVKGMIERIVPEARCAIGHGQMKERSLERVMLDFLNRRYDLLVTTMIIESGLDMPNVNTMIVNRADRFGLAQLYQLRGRIGRSNRQAYAYLLTPPMLAMSTEARRRLATITELTELGSGMKVAMRDLEIRGAGNLLGAQQSGYINAVGFDLYTRLMEEEVGKLREAPPPKRTLAEEEIKLEFDGPALLPAGYIEDGDLRYQFYRRLAEMDEIEEVDRLADEMKDRFGKLPASAGNLLELTRLKILCRNIGIKKLEINKEYLNAELDLPVDPLESQKSVVRLVAAADPDQVEFRVRDKVEMIFRFDSGKRLLKARKFLQRIARKGILQD